MWWRGTNSSKWILVSRIANRPALDRRCGARAGGDGDDVPGRFRHRHARRLRAAAGLRGAPRRETARGGVERASCGRARGRTRRRVRGRAPTCCASTDSGARRRTSATTSTTLASRWQVMAPDLRGHGDSDGPIRSRRRTRSTASPSTSRRWPTPSAPDGFGSSGTRWAGWWPAGSCSTEPRARRRARDDEHRGRAAGGPRSRPRRLRRHNSRSTTGRARPVLDEAAPPEDPRVRAGDRRSATASPTSSRGSGRASRRRCGPRWRRRSCASPWTSTACGGDVPHARDRRRPRRRLLRRRRSRSPRPIPGSRLAVITDSGHHPQFEQPDAWLDAVVSFLEQVDAKAVDDKGVVNHDRRPAAHAGVSGARTLRAHDVDVLFTLNGGHICPALRRVRAGRQIRVIDTRHEQSAAFAAEAWAKVTRRVGVVGLTAGPGVTNGVSAITSAWMNGSPVFVIGGRAAADPLGPGLAAGARPRPARRAGHEVRRARPSLPTPCRRSSTPRSASPAAPHRGPTFVDVPLDGWGPTTVAPDPASDADLRGAAPDHRPPRTRSPTLLAGGPPPGAHARRRRVLGRRRGRGRRRSWSRRCSRSSSTTSAGASSRPTTRWRSPGPGGRAFRDADLVMVVGTPLDFRLGFGQFGDAARDPPRRLRRRRRDARELATSAPATCARAPRSLAGASPVAHDAATRADRETWVATLRDDEDAARAADVDRLTSDAYPDRSRAHLRRACAPDSTATRS